MTVQVRKIADVMQEMLAVARGEIKTPQHRSKVTVESVGALMRILTPENRAMLTAIRDQKPSSVAELSRSVNRAPSNVTRTLNRMEALGLVRMEVLNRTKAPRITSEKILVEIDPFAPNDTQDEAALATSR